MKRLPYKRTSFPMPRILQGIERDVFTCCTCSGLFLGIQDFSFTESVLKKRVACIGTMQIIKGLGIPNKHFATQNKHLYRQMHCLQKLWTITFCFWSFQFHLIITLKQFQFKVQTDRHRLNLRSTDSFYVFKKFSLILGKIW